MHICEWNLSVCVCFNWGRVSASSSLWMCFPLVLCMSESVCVRVGGERESENTAVHAMNTLCDTCQSQGCWVKREKKRRERGRGGKKSSASPLFQALLNPSPLPHAISPNSPSSQCVYLFVCILHSGFSTIFLWACCSLLRFLFSHILSSVAFLSSKTFLYAITTEFIPL